MTARTPEPATVPALLRACLADDAQAVAVLIADVDPMALVFALAAWSNEYGIATKEGSRAAWDEALLVVQQRMSSG
jgi:hypothetical protein